MKTKKIFIMAFFMLFVLTLGRAEEVNAYSIGEETFFAVDVFDENKELETKITPDKWVYGISKTGDVIVCRYQGDAEKAVIPAKIDGRVVRGISGITEKIASGGYGFGPMISLDDDTTKEVVVPCTVTNIGFSAFLEADYNVIIPSSVKVVDNSALMYGFKKDNSAIYCVEGSYIHQYAKEKGLKFVLMAENEMHNWDEGQITRQATVLEEGEKTYTCKDCGNTKSESIARIKSFIKLNVSFIPLRVKQSTSAVKVVAMAKGDTVKSWTSSNKKVAVVNSRGKITGRKAGTAWITVKLASGKTARVKVKVQKTAVKTTKVVLSKKKLTMRKGMKYTLRVARNPVTSIEKITFTSSNKKAAIVSKGGKITAKKKGKTTITVRCGKAKAVCKVTVK